MANNHIRVKDLMTTGVSTLGRNDTLDLMDGVMVLDRMRHLPLFDEGRVVGVVDLWNLFRSALAVALESGERAKRTLLRTVREADDEYGYADAIASDL